VDPTALTREGGERCSSRKVAEFEMAGSIQKEVGWFDISVRQALLMTPAYCSDDVCGISFDEALVQKPAVPSQSHARPSCFACRMKKLIQVTCGEILHDNV
jgi:hypothetical protein